MNWNETNPQYDLSGLNNMLNAEAVRLPVADSYSDTQFEILKRYIIELQLTLDDAHEIGILLTNLGQSKLMHVTAVGYEMPVLMVFKGYVDGKITTLIQHVSQLNFLLTIEPKMVPNEPPIRLGFTAD